METIAVYFSPLASTKIAAAVGLGLAYHMALIYTNMAGQSFGVSSGPSNQMQRQTPVAAFQAILEMADNTPSGFGTIASDPKNNHAFLKGHPEDYYTQNHLGEEYPHAIALTGTDLSARWTTIVRTYAKIGTYHLTYSPLNQNSNSVAGSALKAAGIPIPFSSATQFAPAVFTDLTRFERDRLVSGATRPAADPLPFWGRNSSATAQATEPPSLPIAPPSARR